MAKSANLRFAKPVNNGALQGEELPTRIKILGWGRNATLDEDVTLDEESAKVIYANQRSIGRTTIPLDFNHNTVPGTKAYEADKEPRAIGGYGVLTIVPNDGLYMEYMNWTPSGQKSARDYIDLSPAVITDKNNRVVGVHSCALTPAGAIENLHFYSTDNLSIYSADSMPTLMDQVSSKACGSELNEKSTVKAGDGEKTPCDGVHPNAADLEADRKSKYGDVEYADPSRHKYPINTEAHVRAAWSYINMPKNQGGYSKEELSAIKHRIAAKAEKLGIEIKAMSADATKVQVNAYVTDPYKGIDDMLKEHVDFFRTKLGLPDDAEPEDVMTRLKEVWLAKWEGTKTDTQPLPEKAKGSSVDPTVRNDGAEHQKDVKTTITYSAEELEARRREKYEKKYAPLVSSAIEAAIKPLSAELTALKAEREEKSKNVESEKRKMIKAEASRCGKVIPLSDEQIEQMPVAILESMVQNLKPEVNLGGSPRLRPLSADGKAPAVPAGSMDRAAQKMTDYFSQQGLRWTGPEALGRVSN